MSRGVVYYNFGSKCILRLLVSIYSLRRNYNGPITVFLAENDQDNIKLAKQIQSSVTIKWFDLNEIKKDTKRNVKSVLKPSLFQENIYDSVLMLDADTLIIKPIDSIFSNINEHGLVLTHFNNWFNNLEPMKSRLTNSFGNVLSINEMDHILSGFKSINIGVMGINYNKSIDYVSRWKLLTEKMAGKFISDEIAAHIYPYYKHHVVDGWWNMSSTKVTPENVKNTIIIHSHGNKNYNPKRYASQIWWSYVGVLIEEGWLNPNDDWILADEDASKELHNDGKLITKFIKEYECFHSL